MRLIFRSAKCKSNGFVLPSCRSKAIDGSELDVHRGSPWSLSGGSDLSQAGRSSRGEHYPMGGSVNEIFPESLKRANLGYRIRMALIKFIQASPSTAAVSVPTG